METVCKNLLDWLVFEVECEEKAREMFGERVLVDPSWGQDLSDDIIEYLTSPKGSSVDYRMVAPKKVYKQLPRVVGNTAVSLVKQEVKDFILTCEEYGEKEHDESEIRGHIKTLFKNDFTHRNTLLNLIIEEAIRELNEEESSSSEGENKGGKPRSVRPPNAPPEEPPLVRIGIMDPAADTARGRRVVAALREIFASGQDITDVQVMQTLQEKVDLSEFLYQLKKLKYSMTDLIAFHRREALVDQRDQIESLKRGQTVLPALVSSDDITDLMLTRDEEEQCEELMKIVGLFPEDSMERECGVSRIVVADVMIEMFNSHNYATESLFIKAVIRKLFDGPLKNKKMDNVTAKCFPRFLLKAWRMTQESLGEQLKFKKKPFGSKSKIRIKKEPVDDPDWGEEVVIIDLTSSEEKKKKKAKRAQEAAASVPEAQDIDEPPENMELVPEDRSEDSLDGIQDLEDETQLTRDQKRELEEHLRNAMLGTAYLSFDLEEALLLLPQVTEGGVEGTGLDYGLAKGQVAKMILRVRKQRVQEEQERMRREFLEQGDHQELFRRPLHPTPGKRRPERSTAHPPERSTREPPERSVVPERSAADSRQTEEEGTATAPTPMERSTPPPERSIGSGEEVTASVSAAVRDEEAGEEELSSFIGDEPPIFQSSGREDELRIPKAAKTTKRRLFEREETTPIEAFRRVAKSLQIAIFEGTRASREQMMQQAWARLIDLAPRLDALPEDRKEQHRDRIYKIIDSTTEAEKRGLNITFPIGVKEEDIKLCIRNMFQGENFLDLTLGMVLFELEEVMKCDLIGGIGRIRNIFFEERNVRATVGLIEDVEAEGDVGGMEYVEDEEEEGEEGINWEAVRIRTSDLLRAGNNRATMTEEEIVISVANFCKIDVAELTAEIEEFRKIIKKCKEELDRERGTIRARKPKLVKPPPKRKPRPRKPTWREQGQSINDSFRIDRRRIKKPKQDARLKSALAREIAKQVAEATFLDHPVQPCVGAREFIQEAKLAAKDLWEKELRPQRRQKPQFNSVALAALQEAYEDYGNRLFSSVQIAADHRRTPAEIRNRAMKTITARDLELVKQLRGDERGNILP